MATGSVPTGSLSRTNDCRDHQEHGAHKHLQIALDAKSLTYSKLLQKLVTPTFEVDFGLEYGGQCCPQEPLRSCEYMLKRQVPLNILGS